MPYDSLAIMWMNIGMFGGGLAFGILGLILGATRGMSKNSEVWAITFSAFAWLIAMMIPNVPWAITIFLCGSVGIILSFLPVLKKMGDTNIFIIGIISLIINLLLVFGSGSFTDSLGWTTNIDNIQVDIAHTLGISTTAMGTNVPDHGLCRPDVPKSECEETVSSGGIWDSLLFDVFASIMAIGDYIFKAIKLAGMAVLAPFVIAKQQE